MKTKEKIFIYFVLIFLVIFSFYPIVYAFTNSFMGAAEYARYYGKLKEEVTQYNPFHLIPEWITLKGYEDVFISRPDYLVKFWISLFLSVTILIGQLVIGVLGGYAFSRFRFPGRNAMFFVIVLLMILPYHVTLVPTYIVLEYFNLIDNYAALILPGIFSAFGVFFMRQVMIGLPNNIFEAAAIDGAGSWKALWCICLPNSKPGLSALIILNFADNWNMMEQPLAFLKNYFKYPLSLFLMNVNTMNPALGFACGMLSIVPLLLLFLRFKDDMILGIEYTGVK